MRVSRKVDGMTTSQECIPRTPLLIQNFGFTDIRYWIANGIALRSAPVN
jgi:hypothetical protein